MKIKSKYIYVLFLLVCIHLGHSISGSSAQDPYPTIEIPIFNGGYNLQNFFDASEETKSVTYQLQTNNPPTEVLEFYDAYFNGRGWRSSFETCQRNWEDLSDEPRRGVPLVRQLYASWAHHALNLRAVLWLTYEVGHKESQSEVVVKCQLQPKTGK
ncbi:MAG: hypothetical protein PVI71_02320 [Desulfobacterales bacterium]|jgi:hypothetical protein